MAKTVEEQVMETLTKEAFRGLDLDKLRAKVVPALQQKLETDMLRFIRETDWVEGVSDFMNWDALNKSFALGIQKQIAPESIKPKKKKGK